MKSQKGEQVHASAKRVFEYWFSEEGWNRWEETDQRLSTRLYSKMINIHHDYPMCWACHTPEVYWSRLEICHIIPRDSGDASNLVLMCRSCCLESPTVNHSDASNLILMGLPCHLDSPTVNHSDALFFFLSRKKTRSEVCKEELRDILKDTKLSITGHATALTDILDDSMIKGGSTISPIAWMSLLRAKVADLESDKSLCGDVTPDDYKRAFFLLATRLIDLELNQGIYNPCAFEDEDN